MRGSNEVIDGDTGESEKKVEENLNKWVGWKDVEVRGENRKKQKAGQERGIYTERERGGEGREIYAEIHKKQKTERIHRENRI